MPMSSLGAGEDDTAELVKARKVLRRINWAMTEYVDDKPNVAYHGHARCAARALWGARR